MNPQSSQPSELSARPPYGWARAAVVLAYSERRTPFSFRFSGGLGN